MNKTYLQALALIVIVAASLLYFLWPGDSRQSNNIRSVQEVNFDETGISNADVARQKTSTLAAESPASVQAQLSKATFYSASMSCNAEVDAVLKEYPLNREFFEIIRKQAMDMFSTEAGASRAIEINAINQLFVRDQPRHVYEVVNRQSPNFEEPDLDLEIALRDQAFTVQNTEFLTAIQNNQFSLAESLIRELVAQAPNKIFKVPLESRTALQLALTIKLQAGENPQNDEVLKQVIDAFVAAGYQIQFAELTQISFYLLSKRFDVLDHLVDNFAGNLSTVFDDDENKSTNLVLRSLQFSQLELAAFWLNKGVNPFSNLQDFERLQWFIRLPEPNAPPKSKEAFKTILDSGLLTTRADKQFEEKLNDWLPNGDAAKYYEQHQRISTLSAAQDKRLQAQLAELAHSILLELTGGTVTLSAGCEDEFFAAIRAIQQKMRERTAKRAENSNYEALKKQALAIDDEYNKGLIDADLAMQQLALIDEYLAKTLLSNISNKAAIKEEAQQAEKKRKLPKPDQQPDRALLESLQVALINRDYAKALAIADSLPAYYVDRTKNNILQYALNKNETSEVYRLILNNTNVRTSSVLSAVIGASDTQLLETLAQAGFDLNTVDELNRTLLTMAIKDKHEKAMRALIRLGADIEHPYVGLDALDIALVDIIKGQQNFSFVQRLLSANKRIEDSHRQLFSDLLKMYPEPTQRIIDQYAVVM